jgi:hypothetical protein
MLFSDPFLFHYSFFDVIISLQREALSCGNVSYWIHRRFGFSNYYHRFQHFGAQFKLLGCSLFVLYAYFDFWLLAFLRKVCCSLTLFCEMPSAFHLLAVIMKP